MLTRPDLTGTFGMVASTHWIASAVGQSVLERGGNAFDAAVAAGFTLQVVEPHLHGPGGDLVGLIAPVGGRPRVLAGQGPAPAAATIERLLAEGLTTVPGSGALAATVPGAVDAWLLLLRDHGTWEVGDVLAPAIGYAADGHPLLERVVTTIGAVEALFREDWHSSAALWLPDGRVPRAGALFRNPAWARTLRDLVDAAVGDTRAARIDAVRDTWVDVVGERIGRFVAETPHRHATGGVHRGLLTAADIAGWRAGFEEPVRVDFRGTTVLKAGAWSQGPVLLQALRILDGFPDVDLDLSTGRGVHLALEALKLALADRDAHYGADATAADVDRLLSSAWADERRSLIGETASEDWRPGHLHGEPHLFVDDGDVTAPGAGEPTVDARGRTRGDTCHLDVVDRFGNVASITPSGGWLQSSPTIPELGFALGTRLQMTWLDERSPSALRPGARPRTTLTPTLLARDGQVVSALGTPGGDQQDQWQLPYLLRVLVAGQTPQQAIDAPSFHTMHTVSSFWPRTFEPGVSVVESRLGDDVITDLEARGHTIRVSGPWSLGRLSAVTRDPATGVLGAAANPRGEQGYAVGR